MPKPERELSLEELEHLLRAHVGRVGRDLTKRLPGDVGFCLLVFDMGGKPGWTTYASNAERASMLETLREFLERAELPTPVAGRVRALATRLRSELHGAKLDRLITKTRYQDLAELLTGIEAEMGEVLQQGGKGS